MPNPVGNADAAGDSNASGAVGDNSNVPQAGVIYSIPMAESDVTDASTVLVSNGNRNVERTRNILYRPHVPGGNRNVQRFPNVMYVGGNGDPGNDQRVSSEL